MTAYLLTNHLLNFMAPAAFVALGLVLLARLLAGFFRSKKAPATGLWTQTAIIFVANMLVLSAGLVLLGKDGKMTSYAVMVVGAALCQWVLLRGWKA